MPSLPRGPRIITTILFYFFTPRQGELRVAIEGPVRHAAPVHEEESCCAAVGGDMVSPGKERLVSMEAVVLFLKP